MQDQGIMGLQQAGAPQQAPNDQAMQAFEQARQNMPPEQLDQDMSSLLMEQDPQLAEMLQQRLAGVDLTAEEISVLREIIDELLRNPEQYVELRAAAIEQGIPEGMLPPEFDPAYIGALRVAISVLQPSPPTDQGPMPEAGMPGMEGMPPEPQGFKDGGPVSMKPVAQYLASMGRNGDSMLAHVTPAEVAVLKRMGGSGTINPQTGMPEFFLKWVSKKLSKLGNNIGDAVQDVLKTPIGRTLATIAIGFVAGPVVAGYLGAGGAVGTAVSSMVGSLGTSILAGDDMKTALKSAVVSGVTAGAGDWMAGTPLTGPVQDATIMGQLNKVGDFIRSGTDAIGLTTPDPLKSFEKLDFATNDPLGFDQYEGPGTPQEQTLRSLGIDPAKATAEQVSKRLGIPVEQAAGMLPKGVASTAAETGIASILKDPFSKQNITKTILGGTGLAYLAGAFDPEKTSPDDLGMNLPGSKGYKSGYDLMKERPEDFGVTLGNINVKEYPYGYSPTGTIQGTPSPFFSEQNMGFSPMGTREREYDPYDYTDPRNNPFLTPVGEMDYGAPSDVEIRGFAKGGSVKAREWYRTPQGKYEYGYSPAKSSSSSAWTRSGGQTRATTAANKPTSKAAGVAEAFKLSQANEAAQRRQQETAQAAEVERQRAAAQAAEMERQRAAAVEAERQRAAQAAEAERQRIAAEQAAAAEAERQRIAAEQAAAAEAERQRIAAEQAAAAEAERQRIAAEQAAAQQAAVAAPAPAPTPTPAPAGIASLPAAPVTMQPAVNPTGPQISGDPVPDYELAVEPAPLPVAQIQPTQIPTTPTNNPFAANNPFASASPVGVPNASNIATFGFKDGGIAGLKAGKFPRKTGPINGPGTGTSDSIPAMLSDGEFVFTAKAVRNAGGGSRREGARRMYALMKSLEKQAHG